MTVQHQRGAYEIEFVPFSEALASLPASAVVITDDNVKAHLPMPERPIVSIPAGEKSKSFEVFRQVIQELASRGCDRKTILVAIGGGVVGDLTGFVAATYMRGIPFIQIPTTVLSQVDSSVGGKVGIDLPEGKNLLGSFHAPQRVYICADTLQSLPANQFINGTAEIWKAGFILDDKLDQRLRTERLGPDSPDLEQVIRRGIEIKKETVEADEFERLGIRAKLNFGHTVGHAIEQVQDYEGFLHGEAISIGMVVEAVLGEQLGISAPGTASLVATGLDSQGLPTAWNMTPIADDLLRSMRRDKKATAGRLAFSLLTRVGECTLVEDVSESAVRRALSEYEASTTHR